MNDDENKIYRLNDDISFRRCTIAEGWSDFDVGDCTNFMIVDGVSQQYYRCRQHGIHFHCTKHPSIELEVIPMGHYVYVKCNKCNKEIKIESFEDLLQDCIKLLNMEKFKKAKLIRLDDWYIPELKENIDTKNPDYWIKADVKKDKDQDTIIVLYVGKKNSSEKVQFFIKPEKLQLTNDHKDLDPATILTKIEVTLKDRKITQEYDEKDT